MRKCKVFLSLFVLMISILVIMPSINANAQSKGPNASKDSAAYIACGENGEWTTIYHVNSVVELGTVKGITYDKKANTITLENVSGSKELEINEIGDDFKIVLKGKNTLKNLTVYGYGYGGSATISGDGSLELTGRLLLECERAESNLTICKGVSITANGGILVRDTTLKNPIVLNDGVSISEGGKIVTSSREVYEEKEYAIKDNYFDETTYAIEYKKDGKTIYVAQGFDFETMELKNVEYKMVDGKLVKVGFISDNDLKGYSAKVVGNLYTAAITNKSSIGTEALPKTVIVSSATSSDKSQVKPGKPVVSLTAKKKAAKITIKPTENADGYFIYMANSKTGKYSKIKATTTTNKSFSFTKKKLTKGKTYFFKVRAYKLVDGKKVWGSYSAVKKVTVK